MRARRRNNQAARPGLTLIETALAIVIIGVGVIAMIDAQTAFMRSNAWSSQAATATFLANEIREYSRSFSRHDPVTGIGLDGGVLFGWGPEPGEVTVADYDDLDDFDGVRFGDNGDFPGPINGFGELIPQIDADGNPVLANGNPVGMTGWSQTVLVEKVDPFDPSLVLADNFQQPGGAGWPGRRVGEFPLRVTVIVAFRAPGAVDEEEITRVTWITPGSR